MEKHIKAIEQITADLRSSASPTGYVDQAVSRLNVARTLLQQEIGYQELQAKKSKPAPKTQE